MVNTFAPGPLQWLGIAKETTYGTAIATPSLWIPCDSPQFTPGLNTLVDQNLRGSQSAEFQQVPGMRSDQVTFKTYFYLDSAFALFRAMLGLPDVLTGASDPYTHKTSVQNTGNNGQPAGTTVFFNSADKVWQMPGAIMSELKVTIKTDELATLEVTYMGLPAVAITPPTNTPTTSVPMPSWNSTVTVAGSGNTVYSEISLDIKRETKPIPTLNGTQSPFAIYAGNVTVSGDLTNVFQGSTDVNWVDYLTNVQPAITVQTNPVGDATHYLKLQMSKVGYTKSAFSATNDYVELKSSIRGIANPTDALDSNQSPLQVICLSPVSTAI